MEEDTDYRIQFSSLWFINEHVGFQGTIKSSPSDFIVIEINEQGQLVNMTIDEPVLVSKMLPEMNNFAKKPKLDLQNLPFEDRSNQEVNTLAVCSSGDQNHQPDSEKKDTIDDRTCKQEEKPAVLSSLLDEKTNELLNQFAYDIKEKWNSRTESIEPFPEFSLGRILDKNQRASLHSAIRQKFPFLITVGKNSEIVVKPNLEYKELCHLVSEEEALEFFKYLDAKKENSKFTFKPDTNKDHRKAVHHFVNKKFGNLVETKSFPEQNYNASNPNIVITVRFREKTHKCGKRSLPGCQEGKIIHTAFTLRKENLEMFEAVGFLATKLGVIPSDFSYAGLKDKKAITYQAMVVRKVTPERLKNIEKEIEKKRMNVINIRSVDDSLRLGQLKGNHFDIVIRNLKNKINDSANLRERIWEAIENVKAKGFVNYYGPQRFGKGRKVHTDHIGLALLKSEMVKAVKLFLMPEDSEDPVNRAKKYFLQTENAKGTLSLMPEFKVRERALLEALHRFGMTEEGCIQAWFSFPHSMRIFYIHAYSSKIWNEAVSYRLATYGSKVVKGDLICLDEDIDEHFPNSKVHLVTDEEEAAGTYEIHQVVLPVLGYNIQYPENKVGQWYGEILNRDGLQTCTFKVPALKLNVPGCYRQILKHPRNLSYKLMRDHDTDVKMQGSHIEEATVSLLISFDLDASCYATVCLREIMKHDV
ncbi:Pseudouridylate synthase 7-like protein [Heterocephalus glaber]|uniref:Pseudouridylate synthase PUS7L n=1 Tax=Heterocephalus glaber TaxID=10181 RepID=G5BX29_HETGA|nr:pseudouridylate synthase 7 homolog-like protein isoform X1 [Heterocephalus glaber]EHB13840.1 Pseudouridylate synthase 7-like protein [Heterocephalus glaber]